MPAFRDAVQALARELGQRAAAEVTRAGVAIPGARRPDGSCWVPNVPYLSRPRLADELAAWLGVPALVENDAQLALLGEVWLGRANGRREVILVSVGTGIGGAVMYDGRIRRGAQGAAGAFGWMPVADAGGSEADTWETSAAGRALDTLAHRWRHGASGRDLVAAVRQGETQARQLWETWA